MAVTFHKATKAKSRLRMAICGPAGSGKTYTALSVATHLGEKIALIDTERGSASKYSDLFKFDTLELDTFHPQLFIDAIHAAEEAGYDVVVIDSLSHAWAGKGGVLDQADAIAKRMKSSNSFTAWKEATPLQKALMDAILQSKVHIIATMRSKMEYVLEQVERNGRSYQQPKRVGMAPVQRDDVQYEFDVVGEMDDQNNMVIVKTRCASLAGEIIQKPGKGLAKQLKGWLTDGVDVPVPVVPKPAEHIPETEAKEEVLHGEHPPELAPASEPPAEKEAAPPVDGQYWDKHVAAQIGFARNTLQTKLREKNPEATFTDVDTKAWLNRVHGLTSHKQATKWQVAEMTDWMRRCYNAGEMVE